VSSRALRREADDQMEVMYDGEYTEKNGFE
jgi:hypothetical protein